MAIDGGELNSVTVTGSKSNTSFSVSDFRTKLGVIARPNLFNCYLTGSTSFDALIPNFNFRCEKAEFPGRTIATTDDTFSGPTLKLPYDMTYNDITLSIICSEDMQERLFFEKWMDLIVKPASQPDAGTIAYHSEYARGIQLKIQQLSSVGSGRIISEYTCHDVYPIAIAPVI